MNLCGGNVYELPSELHSSDETTAPCSQCVSTTVLCQSSRPRQSHVLLLTHVETLLTTEKACTVGMMVWDMYCTEVCKGAGCLFSCLLSLNNVPLIHDIDSPFRAFLAEEGQKNPKWIGMTTLGRSVIPIRFGVFWPKRAKTTTPTLRQRVPGSSFNARQADRV